jgi:hypothetical protein
LTNRIAREGYYYNPNKPLISPVAFFPLHPLLARGVTRLFSVDTTISVLIVSVFAIIITAPLAIKLFREMRDDETALLTIAPLRFFPTSFFFTAGFTESVAFFFIIAFFLSLQKERFFLAAVCAGFATATRLTNIVILLPPWWEILKHYRTSWKDFITKTLALTITAASGLWCYMIYLWRAFDHPLAFVTAEHSWLEGDSVTGGLFKALTLQTMKHLGDVFHEGIKPATLDLVFFFCSRASSFSATDVCPSRTVCLRSALCFCPI